jgi:two-component system alkaline phosphatase synthesis response regulator PhoP
MPTALRATATHARPHAMSRILVIDDEPDIQTLVRYNLEREGHHVTVASNGNDGLHELRRGHYDLILLDLMLPDRDGLEVCRVMRADPRMAGVPIIMITAKGEESDVVIGLGLGADDYVTKPFGLLELLARVEALLRRAAPPPSASVRDAAPAPIRFGEVEIDLATRSTRLRGDEVALTPKELDLLLALIGRGGRIATRVELMREVWGHRAAIISRTVDTHVAELRRKLEHDPANPRHILTVRKAGYRFQG